MKRILSILLAVILSVALTSSFSAVSVSGVYTNIGFTQTSPIKQNPYMQLSTGVQLPRPTKRPRPAATPVAVENIVVHNSDEFFKALKSNVNIKLLPGDYNMSQIVKSKYVYYNNKGYDYDYGPTIKSLNNVRVYSDSSVRIHSEEGEFNRTLVLIKCSNITFDNVSFGRKDTTPGGVLSFYSCKNVEIKNCDFSGWKYPCFNMNKCNSITIRDSKIHDSRGGILWTNNCKDVSFYNTEIYNNSIHGETSVMGNLQDSTGILFSTCNFHDNGSADSVSDRMFAKYDAELTMDQCVLSNNKYRIPSTSDL